MNFRRCQNRAECISVKFPSSTCTGLVPVRLFGVRSRRVSIKPYSTETLDSSGCGVTDGGGGGGDRTSRLLWDLILLSFVIEYLNPSLCTPLLYTAGGMHSGHTYKPLRAALAISRLRIASRKPFLCSYYWD